MDLENNRRVVFITQSKDNVRYGIQCLSAVLKQNNYKVYLFDIRQEDLLINDIKKTNPSVIAYSCMTGEFKEFYQVNTLLKKELNYLSLWGGPHPTFFSKIIYNKGIDGICIGEGEDAILELLEKYINAEDDFYSTKNWVLKMDENNEEVIFNGVRSFVDLNKLPIPDFEIFNLYGKSSITVFLSRGCYYNCTYCFNHEYKNIYKDYSDYNKIRFYDVEKAIEILETVKVLKEKYNFEYIHFDDDIFPINTIWLIKFRDEYKKTIKIPFDINLQPLLVDDEKIKILKEAGLFRVNIAIESGSERIRKSVLNRHMSNRKIIESANIIKKNGLLLHIQNITCLPDETWNDAKETFELNIECKSDISVISKFVPYPGSRLTAYSLGKGYLKEGFENNIPDNYHWISILDLPNKREKQKMEYLVNFFTLGVKYPWLKKLIFFLVSLPKNRFLEKLFAHIDNQVWLTITHKKYFYQINDRKFLVRLLLLIKLAKRLFIPAPKIIR